MEKWSHWMNQLDLFTAFKLDFLDGKLTATADSQSNKINFIGFLFCHIDETRTRLKL